MAGQTVKPWSIGIIGLAGLAAIVAGAYASPEVLLAVAVAHRRRQSASAGPTSSASPPRRPSRP